MGTVKDESAFPTTPGFASGLLTGGLTKRELIAIECHAQMIRFVQRGYFTSEEAAELAIEHADALISALSEET